MKDLDSVAPALLDDLYERTTDPQQWPAFLDKFANLFHSETATLRLTDLHDPVVYHSYITGFRRTINQYYESEAVDVDPFRDALSTTPVGKALTSTMVIENREFERSAHYQNVFRPNGNFYALGCQFMRKGTQAMHIGVHRPKQKGAFTPKECRTLEFFSPHLRRVIKLSQLMTELNQSLTEKRSALDQLSFSVWQMDAGWRLNWRNQGAEEIFAEGAYGLYLSNNRLNSHSAVISSSLRQMTANLLENRSHTETVRINPNGACLTMTLSCASGADVRIGRSAIPGILCFILDPDLPNSLDPAQLRDIYQLTPAELRLANLMVSGLDVSEASALLQISKHTGRTQLKSIMQKTGVNRQAGLQRKLLICAGILRSRND